ADQFDLQVTARDLYEGGLGGGPAGQANVTQADQEGKSFAGFVEMDKDGGGQGWYFSEVHVGLFNVHSVDNAEFTNVEGRFRASTPRQDSCDFYSTALHETGPALGISAGAVDAVPGITLTPAGIDEHDSDSVLLKFAGATRTYTFTTNGGGHL